MKFQADLYSFKLTWAKRSVTLL